MQKVCKIPQEQTQSPIVQWYSNGSRFGRLLKSGPKWSIVLYLGRKRKLPTADITPYKGT